MKKFINHPEDAVEEMLQGLAVLHPGSARLPGHKALIRVDAASAHNQQVAILSGGGSGHEPAHAGYIGAGMLSAAIAGEVFTSPSSDTVYAAIQAVSAKPGALLVVKNYTGDRLNFGLAAEMARAEGTAVEIVVVDDDVAVEASDRATGARGLAGTVFIHKVVGAAAAEGKSLVDLVAIGKEAVASLATMGVSFSAGTSPAVGRPSFELGEQEMELGLGIHGEPGVRRMQMQPADELAETLLNGILRQGKFAHHKRVAVLVNNLGATTEMELAIVARHVVSSLAARQFTVERIYAGTFLSSLDMAGISISLLALNDERLRWIDAPTTAPAWPNVIRQRPGQAAAHIAPAATTAPSQGAAQTELGRATKQAIEAACNALLAAEDELTELDRITGDGDLGISMARGAHAVLAELDAYPSDASPAAVMLGLSATVRRVVGGTSGPLYAVMLLRAAAVLDRDPTDWPAAFTAAVDGVVELGGAQPGDRTMVDALRPAAEALAADGGTLDAAVSAAERGAAATASMSPRLGRSSYLGDRVLGDVDPGAHAVALWLAAIRDARAG
jgi:triose/dihydroxyacetone kinase / FAD-AMP lyase (cyclizing)